jgi:arylformamidase
MIADWDDAYANAVHIPGGAHYPDRWRAAAADFRSGLAPDRRRTGLPYGHHPREKVDLFLPEGRPKGLAVFVHGGYWLSFDRDVWSHLAAGPLAHGWAVAMPGYVLAPEARVAAITGMIARAVAAAASVVPGSIVLAGHSAGGHLVTRQVCTDSALPPAVRARILRVVSISGVHDLRPLLRLKLNEGLHLDAAEGPEFVRQTTLRANIWTGLGAEMSQVIEPGRHHFDVIEGLADPDSAITAALDG